MRRWAALYRCFPGLEGQFFTSQLTGPANVITAWQPIHHALGAGEICLTPSVSSLSIVHVYHPMTIARMRKATTPTK